MSYHIVNMVHRLKKAIFPFLLLLVVVAYHTAAGQKAVVINYVPTLTLVGEAPKIAARAYAIFDAEIGTILQGDNEQEVLPIASVTKLFTAAVVLRAGEAKSSEITITSNDISEEGHSGRLSVGQTYTAYELLFPLLLESSNDAAAALERLLSPNLIANMNELASSAGVGKITFADASGLSELNTSSAADLVYASTYLYKSEPHLFDITILSKRAGSYVGFTNNSPVFHASYRGGKHGYTAAAGKTLVAFYDELLPDKTIRTIGYVILGSKDLSVDLAILRQFTTTSASFE